MAKTTAPLGSFSASGKVGKAHVHSTHLGRSVVRGLVTPANRKTVTQGAARLMFGGLSAATRRVVVPSIFVSEVKTILPVGQTWISYFIKTLTSAFGTGSAGYTALKNAWAGHVSSGLFTSYASFYGVTDVTIDYAAVGSQIFTKGMQLYALAYFAVSVHNANPTVLDYPAIDKALASWDDDDITAFTFFMYFAG